MYYNIYVHWVNLWCRYTEYQKIKEILPFSFNSEFNFKSIKIVRIHFWLCCIKKKKKNNRNCLY